MSTIKQKLAVQKIIENRGNVSKSMREVGYSENSAINPKNLTESKGFKEICEEAGLTDDFLTKALYEDIKNKPKKREKELRLAFQVVGKLKDNEPKTTNNLVIIESDQTARIARRAIARLSGSQESPD